MFQLYLNILLWLVISTFTLMTWKKRETQLFTEMLDTIGLQQHVQGPTHVKGHTLDLLISRKSQNIVLETTVLTGLPSDHHAIISELDFARPGPSKKRVVYRKLREIDVDRCSRKTF